MPEQLQRNVSRVSRRLRVVIACMIVFSITVLVALFSLIVGLGWDGY